MSKILIVDDEYELSQAIGCLLEKQGYEIFYALTGEEAIEMVKIQNPDVILLDICLPKPGIDGLEALSAIRKFNKEVKVIITSGLDKNDNRLNEIEKLDIYKSLPKPLTISLLKETLKEILKT